MRGGPSAGAGWPTSKMSTSGLVSPACILQTVQPVSLPFRMAHELR